MISIAICQFVGDGSSTHIDETEQGFLNYR